jgi:hypothetical protein
MRFGLSSGSSRLMRVMYAACAWREPVVLELKTSDRPGSTS